ncbi:hypothetical protein M436DRAFT_62264 [Aureobasidium namibiae CBS 147.97]|uniref:Uncharacterized protein n=1 Tax=Aureobasidium namibiae CBS 147.97 TaxID=1043004 RepID=A0A074WNV0_9PEZI
MKREASSDPETRPVAKQARLSLDALDSDHASNLLVKPSVDSLFRRLCTQFGWSPTELTCAKISDLLSIDTSRNDNLEPALFAFVQHLPFVWNDGALFIGSKRINGVVRSVWYKPARLGDSVGESMYLSQRDNFEDESIVKSKSCHTGAVVDRTWPSFTTAVDLSGQRGDYRYIVGVHNILLEFPKLRKSCNDYELQAWAAGRLTSATDYIPLKKYELPFLPESVWMSKPIGWRSSQDARPLTPSGSVSSRSSRQSSATTARHPSIKDIERVQTMIQGHLRRRVADSKQQERLSSGPRSHNILKPNERVSESIETDDMASEATTEASLNASSDEARESIPRGLLSLDSVEHVAQILRENSVDISFGDRNHAAEAQIQLTVTFPARISQQKPTLQFSSIATVDVPPVMPPRRLVLEALCAMALSATDDDNQS